MKIPRLTIDREAIKIAKRKEREAIQRAKRKAINAGAQCDRCPLNDQRVVYPPVSRKARSLVIVGEGPGYEEEKRGAFFVGRSGECFNEVLQKAGTDRSGVNVTNATLCRLPYGTTPSALRKAAACCAPRLRKDLRSLVDWKRGKGKAPVIVAMGSAALFTLTGKKTITPWVGASLDLTLYEGARGYSKAQVLPVFHVTYAMHAPVYWVAVLRHLALAVKLAKGGKAPTWQQLVTAKNDREAKKALTALKRIRARGDRVGLDIETAGASPWAPITAVGIADRIESVSILGEFFERPVFRKVIASIVRDQETIAHNGWHDVLGLRASGIEVKRFWWDTLLLHATIAPFMRHNLSIVTAIEIPGLDRWKSSFKDDDRKGRVEWKTIAQQEPDRFLTYNCKDAAALPRLRESLWGTIAGDAQLERRYIELMQLSAIAASMREIGIVVDLKLRGVQEKALRRRRSSKVRDLRRLAIDLRYGKAKSVILHPRKRGTLIDLLHRFLGLPVQEYSKKTGQPSTSEGALVRLMLKVPDRKVQKICRTILAYRKYDKLIGTYLARLNPKHPEPHVDSSGIIRASFNFAGTGTGRASCSDPNMQNWPPAMRDLVVASPGWWILCADFGQLELRIAAAFAGDLPLLRAFRSGADIHEANARSIFPGFDKQGPKERKELRSLAKRYVYGARGGGPEAIWMAIIVEAPESGITVSTIRKIDKAWKKAHPRLGRFEREIVNEARTKDRIVLPLSGRAIHYHGKVKPTEPIAHMIQGTAADVMNGAFIKLQDSLNPKRERILSQIHDEIMLETRDPVKTAEKMRKAMETTITLNGNEIDLPIDYKVGRRWGSAKGCDTIEEVAKVVKAA